MQALDALHRHLRLGDPVEPEGPRDAAPARREEQPSHVYAVGMTALRDDAFETVAAEMMAHPDNADLTARGWTPIFTGSRTARVVIVSQAPGRIAQESGIPFRDASGLRLTRWLGVAHEQLIDPRSFAIVPMDFYYPGKAASGDLPPRRGIAERWHPRLLEILEEATLTVLVGSYAQRHVLGTNRRKTLTDTVHDWRAFAPAVVPIVHPSPLNTGWLARHPWFESRLVPELQAHVADALAAPPTGALPPRTRAEDPESSHRREICADDRGVGDER